MCLTVAYIHFLCCSLYRTQQAWTNNLYIHWSIPGNSPEYLFDFSIDHSQGSIPVPVATCHFNWLIHGQTPEKLLDISTWRAIWPFNWSILYNPHENLPDISTAQLAQNANWPFNWLILDSWPQKNTWYFNYLILGNQPQKLFDLSTEQYQAIDHRNYLTFQLINTRQLTTDTIWPFQQQNTRQSTIETIWPFNCLILGNDHRHYLTFQLKNTRQSTTETIWPFNWKIPGNPPQKLFDLSTEKYQAINPRCWN